MVETLHLKKIFLMTVIVSLILAALVGVVIFLLGNFGEIEIKILSTTGLITGYSLLSLFFSWLYEKKKFKPFAEAILASLVFDFIAVLIFIWGINTSYQETILKFSFSFFSLAWATFWAVIFYYFFKEKKLRLFTGSSLILIVPYFIFSLLSIWNVIEGDIYTRIFGIIFIIAFSTLHISLLWLVRTKELPVDISLFFTITMVCIVAILLTIWIIGTDNFDLPPLFYRVLGAFAILDGVGTIVTLIIRKVVSLQNNSK